VTWTIPILDKVFKGIFIVARRDFLANLKSIRMILIAVIMVLATFGAIFGLSGLSRPPPAVETILWVHPGKDTSGANLAAVWASDPSGIARAGLTLHLSALSKNAPPMEIGNTTTDGQGFATFTGLTPNTPYMISTDPGATGTSEVAAFPGMFPYNFTANFRQFDLAQDGTYGNVAVHAMDIHGHPAVGAEVRLNQTHLGVTDPRGFFTAKLNPGQYLLSVTYNSEVQNVSLVQVNSPRPSGLSSGPDFVLFFLAFFLMGFLGPIMAVALSYDAVAKERFQGSMELLLVRPASRLGLALGKFLGTLATAAIPILGPVLVGAGVLTALTGKPPSGAFVLTFVGASLVLLALYVLITQVFSTVVRSPGTAVLAGVLVWLFFNVLYNIVTFLVLSGLHIDQGSEAGTRVVSLTLLLNPTGIFQALLSLSAGSAIQGSAPTSFSGLPIWIVPVAAAAWVIVLLVLAVLVFQRRAAN
jgi:ABC-2 type transport system permease protein